MAKGQYFQTEVTFGEEAFFKSIQDRSKPDFLWRVESPKGDSSYTSGRSFVPTDPQLSHLYERREIVQVRNRWKPYDDHTVRSPDWHNIPNSVSCNALVEITERDGTTSLHVVLVSQRRPGALATQPHESAMLAESQSRSSAKTRRPSNLFEGAFSLETCAGGIKLGDIGFIEDPVELAKRSALAELREEAGIDEISASTVTLDVSPVCSVDPCVTTGRHRQITTLSRLHKEPNDLAGHMKLDKHEFDQGLTAHILPLEGLTDFLSRAHEQGINVSIDTWNFADKCQVAQRMLDSVAQSVVADQIASETTSSIRSDRTARLLSAFTNPEFASSVDKTKCSSLPIRAVTKAA